MPEYFQIHSDMDACGQLLCAFNQVRQIPCFNYEYLLWQVLPTISSKTFCRHSSSCRTDSVHRASRTSLPPPSNGFP